LPKYYYKPILSVVEESYLENAQKPYTAAINIQENVRMVVESETENEGFEAMYGFIDVRMWELDRVED
jgi:hypothetical protein